MKKQILIIASGLFTAGIIALSGCAKDDSSLPVIKLKGDATVYHVLNTEYKDAGATAEDDKAGDITSAITTTNPVKKDLVGAYKVTYNVSDATGNSGTATRTVIVYNEAGKLLSGDYLSGGIKYNVSDDVKNDKVYTYEQTVTPSTTVNNKISFDKFANYIDNTNIYATVNVSAKIIELPQQIANNIGDTTPKKDHEFQGTGTISGFTFVLSYKDKNISNNNSIAECIATFTKQ